MITLAIDGFNINDEMGIVLEHFDIGIPEPKIHKVSVPGRNGDLDMTRALTGFTHFHNRTINLTLGLTGSETDREEKRSALFQITTNKQVKVEFSHLNGYFLGNITFHSYERNPAKSTIQASVDCYPFKISNEEVSSSIALSSTPRTIHVLYLGMPVPMLIKTTGNAIIEHKGNRYSVAQGEHKLGIVLEVGNNEFTLSGSGTLSYQYRMEEL